MLEALRPALPDHCAPANPFLYHLSSHLHTCLPTPLAATSQLLGALSICAWLFAQLPQIYKNYSISSTSGLSIFFLVEWCLGDFSNLLGALFTHQASWQVVIGSYYVFVDVCLVGQWVWYERLKDRGRRREKGWFDSSGGGGDDWEEGRGMMESDTRRASGENASVNGGDQDIHQPARPRIIFRAPTFQPDSNATEKEKEKSSPSFFGTPSSSNTIHRVVPSSSLPSPSPRTILLLACLAAIAHASPLSHIQPQPPTPTATPLENAGTILSWLSTLLYLVSRLPQLLKNYRRKSTAGLSPALFAAAFCGNLFYSSALLTNPRAWEDFGPYGGGGWAGPEGSDRAAWCAAALPFFLGAAGVLGLDASVGVQFLAYGERDVVVEAEGRGKGRWRRVRGWMRGWAPSVNEDKGVVEEERALLSRSEGHGEGYGAL